MARNPVRTLKVAELNIANRLVGVDVLAAIGRDDHPERWNALAAVGWLHEKRERPRAAFEPWTDLTVEELVEKLEGMGFSLDDDGEDDDDQAALEQDPTDPAPSP